MNFQKWELFSGSPGRKTFSHDLKKAPRIFWSKPYSYSNGNGVYEMCIHRSRYWMGLKKKVDWLIFSGPMEIYEFRQ